MSEMVLVLGVMALTVAVLLWVLVLCRKWLRLRDQLMSQTGEATPSAGPRLQQIDIPAAARRAANLKSVPERRREPQRAAA